VPRTWKRTLIGYNNENVALDHYEDLNVNLLF
jgi:hypothetical protein